MIITRSSVLAILAGIKQYEIFVDSSEYVWIRENNERLMEAINKAGSENNSNSCIGAVILREDKMVNGVSVCHVIDGWQRLTAVQLQHLAIENYWSVSYRNWIFDEESTDPPAMTATFPGAIKHSYLVNAALAGTDQYSRIMFKNEAYRKEYENLLHGNVGSGMLSEWYSFFTQEFNTSRYDPETIIKGIDKTSFTVAHLYSKEDLSLLFDVVNDIKGGCQNI